MYENQEYAIIFATQQRNTYQRNYNGITKKSFSESTREGHFELLFKLREIKEQKSGDHSKITNSLKSH